MSSEVVQSNCTSPIGTSKAGMSGSTIVAPLVRTGSRRQAAVVFRSDATAAEHVAGLAGVQPHRHHGAGEAERH